MRCVNCGFDNEPGRQVCLKCGTPLSQDDYSDPVQSYNKAHASEAKPTVVFDGVHGQSVGAPQLKKTVVQMDGNDPLYGGRYTPKATVVQNVPERCPRCQYPMSGNFCANCGYEVPGTEAASEKDSDISNTQREKIIRDLKNRHNKCTKCNAEVPAEFKFCPYCAEPIHPATINPFAEKVNGIAAEEEPVVNHRFTLTPLDGDGNDLPDIRSLEFTDNSIILNRENTSPGNLTITSKEQAEISFTGDKWELKNCSDFNSTFVAANRPIELQPGDVILMGDQRFRFDPVGDEDE